MHLSGAAPISTLHGDQKLRLHPGCHRLLAGRPLAQPREVARGRRSTHTQVRGALMLSAKRVPETEPMPPAPPVKHR